MKPLPQKLPETSRIPLVARICKTVNALIDVARASQVRESPTTRVEQGVHGQFVQAKVRRVSGGDGDTWY